VFFFLYFSAAMIISRLNGVPFLLMKIFLKPKQRNKYEYYVHMHTCVYANIIFKRLSFPFILCAVRYHYEHSAHDRPSGSPLLYTILLLWAYCAKITRPRCSVCVCGGGEQRKRRRFSVFAAPLSRKRKLCRTAQVPDFILLLLSLPTRSFAIVFVFASSSSQ